MSSLNRSLFIILIVLTPWISLGKTPQELFDSGTQSYLTKDYNSAQEHFSQLLELDPQNAVALTNLALTEFHLGKKPLAIGLLRKALTYDPSSETARSSLQFIKAQTPIQDSFKKSGVYEWIRLNLLQPIPLFVYLTLSSLCFLTAGWALIKYGVARKKALEEEKHLPPLPIVSGLLVIGLILFTGLSVLQIYDATIPRATVISDTVALQTAPGENQVTIHDLPGGAEVIVRDSKDDWVQVTSPNSITGWVKKSSLLMTR